MRRPPDHPERDPHALYVAGSPIARTKRDDLTAGTTGYAGCRKSMTGLSESGSSVEASALTAKMATGSAWMIFMRWAIRLIGFASTLVLVRLLSPSDFGVIAIATIVTGFFEVFTDTGQRLAIIRHPNPTREYLDSAWTAQFIVCAILSLAAFFAAPLAEIY